MPGTKLRRFLDDNHVKYVTIRHSPAYTALALASSAHVPRKELAKTVVVKVNGKMAITVLPASRQLDVGLLKEAIGADKLELASEDEFEQFFPDCEVGAMPPFGNLYNLDVYCAEDLKEDEDIVFNAGSHREAIRMAYADFERLVQPHLLRFTAPLPN